MAGVKPMKGLVPRPGWGARLPIERIPFDRNEVQGLSFHYTGSNADETQNHAFCPARVRAVQNFHMDVKGWLDGAYGFLVCIHGAIYEMRGWRTRSAANGTNRGNDAFVPVCFLGNDSEGRADLTRAAKGAMERIVARYHVWYAPRPRIAPHSAFVVTECPGDEIRKWLQEMAQKNNLRYIPRFS